MTSSSLLNYQKYSQSYLSLINPVHSNPYYLMLSDLQKKSLSKLLERYSFQHLRPSPEVYQITVPQEEYFLVSGSERRRRIFYKVSYQNKEIQAIQEVKDKIKSQQIKNSFSDHIFLKHIYGAKWNLNKAVDRIHQLFEFHTNQNILKFDDETIKFLQNGCFYTYGHDKGMRPNIILRIDKINFKQSLDTTLNAYYYLMLIILGYKMVPYYAEKYNLIMDFNDISLTHIPFAYLYESLEKMNVYYCCNSEKTFLYNSEGIRNLWRIVSFFLPENQKKRVIFINKGQEKQILQYIDEYELERRYGGKLSNLTKFWPPKNTSDSFDLKLNQEKPQESFYSVQNDEQYFDIVSVTQTIRCGPPNCQCQIY